MVWAIAFVVIFIVIGGILAGYRDSGAVDYRMFGESKEGIFYYDIESITYPSNFTVDAWVKENFSGPGVAATSRALGQDYRNLDHSVSQVELNCKDKTFRQLSLTFYAKDGSVMSSSKNMVKEFEAIKPNSVNEALYKTLCK